MSADAASRSAFARVRALIGANRWPDALAHLATLPAADALSAEAHRLRCIALVGLSRWAEAADAARAGLQAGGADPDLLHLLGVAEQELGHPRVAERVLLDGLAMAPHHTGLLCAYAMVCLADGQVDKAAKLVALAAAVEPHDAGVYQARVQVAYARGDDREAQRIAREFVGAYPESPAAHSLLGSTSAARGQFGEAYAGLRQAVAHAPQEESLGKAALEAKIARHPLLVPIRPVLRFGPLKTWIVAIVVIYGLRALGLPGVATVFAAVWVCLCVYSWVVPALVRRRVRRHWH